MGAIVCRTLLGISLCAGTLAWAAAPHVLEASPTMGDPDSFIVFLIQHAKDAARHAHSGAGSSATNRAAQLHVRSEDVSLIDQEAQAYAAEDQKIHEEALQYREQCISANKPLDPAVVHSFTTRREAQAAVAFSEIQSQLSPSSYAGLNQYLTSIFIPSLKRQQVRK